jgi:Zn-dependent protease with chaperone function
MTYQEDMLTAAKKVVPLLIAIMAWAFSTYLILKGLKKIWKVDFLTAGSVGFAFALILYFAVRPFINKAAKSLENNKFSVNKLFTIPLIFAAPAAIPAPNTPPTIECVVDTGAPKKVAAFNQIAAISVPTMLLIM